LKFNPLVIVNDGESPLVKQIENVIEKLLNDKRELNNREDIDFLVHSFYKQVLKDEKLSPFFTDNQEECIENHGQKTLISIFVLKQSNG
jgi:hypothetical protein